MFDDFDGAETLHCPYCGKSFWYSVDVTRAYWPRKDDTEDAK